MLLLRLLMPEQYVGQVVVLEIAGKQSFLHVVRSLAGYSLVAQCCMLLLHAISFANTLCISLVPSQDGSNKLRFESTFNLYLQ